MRIVTALATIVLSTAAMTGYAAAIGSGGIGGGTPDAQNGARGRDLPSSFEGRNMMYSGRSVGFDSRLGYNPYGYRRGPGYGYGPAYGHAPYGYRPY